MRAIPTPVLRRVVHGFLLVKHLRVWHPIQDRNDARPPLDSDQDGILAQLQETSCRKGKGKATARPLRTEECPISELCSDLSLHPNVARGLKRKAEHTYTYPELGSPSSSTASSSSSSSSKASSFSTAPSPTSSTISLPVTGPVPKRAKTSLTPAPSGIRQLGTVYCKDTPGSGAPITPEDHIRIYYVLKTLTPDNYFKLHSSVSSPSHPLEILTTKKLSSSFDIDTAGGFSLFNTLL
ncbi:hypothetical protein ONZ45_g15179 [Pleurotus djamor]|nr:hypothetical protein ONZ45_g15179 [Pleurotus djamor]